MTCTQSERPEDTYVAREEGLTAADFEAENELSAEQILAADDLPVKPVAVPEWKGHVYVRMMTGSERDGWELFLVNNRTPDRKLNARNIRATLLVQAVCNAAGERIFDDNQVERLGGKSSAALDRLYEAAERLNRLSKDDIEELAKNSEDAPSDSPPSVCAESSGSCTPTSSSPS